MLFLSVDFLVFFLLLVSLYWSPLAKKVSVQNGVLLIASYFLYALWNWEFVPLLIVFSSANFIIGKKVAVATNLSTKKQWKTLAVFFNICILFYFKYVGFYLSSFASLLGIQDWQQLSYFYTIGIPLGISYFVFRGLGYVLDIYKRKCEPIQDPVIFFNYIAFFPSVIAGPIDTSKSFSTQLVQHRHLDVLVLEQAGIKFIWGLFKKITVSSACGTFASPILASSESHSSFILLLAAFAIAIQIYSDFSGYCDMAESLALVLGIQITRNFNYPFFATSIVEFWRRWHISLTNWLTAHVYTPLTIAMRDYGKWGLFAAIVINMVVCGIWHGPNTTFIVFGLLHGCLFIWPLATGKKLSGKQNMHQGNLSVATLFKMLGVFCLVSIADVIFTSTSVAEAGKFVQNLCFYGWIRPVSLNINGFYGLFVMVAFMCLEWMGRHKEYPLAKLFPKAHPFWRWNVYALLLFIIGLTIQSSITPFVYQQF
jgi:alginate O-acetyltransferase complex protein AlgI